MRVSNPAAGEILSAQVQVRFASVSSMGFVVFNRSLPCRVGFRSEDVHRATGGHTLALNSSFRVESAYARYGC
jgi:hypothetical protein